MADPGPSPAELEERIAGLAEAVTRLIGVVSKLDDSWRKEWGAGNTR